MRKIKYTPHAKENHCTARWLLNGFLSTKCLRNAFHAVIFIVILKIRLLILERKIHILAKQRFPRVFHSDPVFSTKPCVFHQTPCFPHPAFSTLRDPEPRTTGHRPRVFHLAVWQEILTLALSWLISFFLLFCFFLRLILFTANDYNFLHFTPNGLIGLTVSPIESLLRLVKPPIDIIFSINCCCYLLA